MPVEVAAEGDFLVYRVRHDGRTHTAYNPVIGTGRWLAFDPARDRFSEVASSLLVTHDISRRPGGADRPRRGTCRQGLPRSRWALLRMPKQVNPAEAARSLASDPSVKSAELLLRADIRVPIRMPPTGDRGISPRFHRPPSAASPASPLPGSLTTGPLRRAPTSVLRAAAGEGYPANAKNALAPDLLAIFGDTLIEAGQISIEARVLNWGPGQVRGDRNDHCHQRRAEMGRVESLERNRRSAGDRSAKPRRLGCHVYLELARSRGRTTTCSCGSRNRLRAPGAPTRTATTRVFSLDASGRVVVRCRGPGTGGNPAGAGDPFTGMQWHLANTGQRAFARNGGRARRRPRP